MSKTFEFHVNVPMIDIFAWEIEGPEDATDEELRELGWYLNTLDEGEDFPIKFGRFIIKDYLGDDMDTMGEDPTFTVIDYNYNGTHNNIKVINYEVSENECKQAVVCKEKDGKYVQVSGHTDYDFACNYAKELRRNWGGAYYVWDEAMIAKYCKIVEDMW